MSEVPLKMSEMLILVQINSQNRWETNRRTHSHCTPYSLIAGSHAGLPDMSMLSLARINP